MATSPQSVNMDTKDSGSKEFSTMPSVSSAADHETLDLFEGGIDPIYQAKARILNDALQEIGMGKYQVCLR